MPKSNKKNVKRTTVTNKPPNPDNKAATKRGNKVKPGDKVAFVSLPVEESWKTWDMAYQVKGGRRKLLSGLWIDFQKQTVNEMWLGFGIEMKQNKKTMKAKKTLKKPMKGKKTLTKAVEKTKTKPMHVTKMKAAIARLGAQAS